ncbi:MAG TPA: hypothetical protein VM943_06200 [Pyrinomonadaceae bacterium]|nr:hypothetical protein [Pyrinomonadaceae bacterium]
MGMKRVCSRCGITSDEGNFAFRSKTKGTRHSYCLPCGREFSTSHYSNNVRYYVKKARVRRDNFRREINIRLYDYLEKHPCVDCGESDPVVLEFDHVRGEKSFNVSEMGWMVLTWDAMLKEIAKCDVRCANCHRRKTAGQRRTYKYLRFHGPLAQFG